MSRSDIPTIPLESLSHYEGEKHVDLGFVGSCMVHKGDIKIVSKMLKNLEELYMEKLSLTHLLYVTAPTYNIIEELKAEGDWEVLTKVFRF